jgi:hypothetical protein
MKKLLIYIGNINCEEFPMFRNVELNSRIMYVKGLSQTKSQLPGNIHSWHGIAFTFILGRTRTLHRAFGSVLMATDRQDLFEFIGLVGPHRSSRSLRQSSSVFMYMAFEFRRRT